MSDDNPGSRADQPIVASAADDLLEAREAFDETFRAVCRLPLSPEAERKLAEIFTLTLGYAIAKYPDAWKDQGTFALGRVREIARLARRNSCDGQVTESALATSADRVILFYKKTECDRGRVKVCEAYQVGPVPT
ncbi:MAG TPA: hypothetical protein VFX98_08710 [Longimicrobiaceae bacterium]|nr:hypothetical protein [Longimicrobiaceae bacterium]